MITKATHGDYQLDATTLPGKILIRMAGHPTYTAETMFSGDCFVRAAIATGAIALPTETETTRIERVLAQADRYLRNDRIAAATPETIGIA